MNERGQMTIETILIIGILLGAEILISKTARQQQWMQSLVGAPWKPLRAMIEDGTWTVQNSKNYNPAMWSRHGTPKGEPLQQ